MFCLLSKYVLLYYDLLVIKICNEFKRLSLSWVDKIIKILIVKREIYQNVSRFLQSISLH